MDNSFATFSLYVGDLHVETSEGEIFDVFSRAGAVASIRVIRDACTQKSLCHAYVNFHNQQDAERALDCLNFTEFNGKQCRISWSMRNDAARLSGEGNVFVKNLPDSIDNKALFDLFSAHGNILSCKVATTTTGQPMGHGYVRFQTEEEASAAIVHLNETKVHDSIIYASKFMKRETNHQPGENVQTQQGGSHEHLKELTLFVRGLPDGWGNETLYEMFSMLGSIARVSISRDGNGKPKGYGFVVFSDRRHGEAALELISQAKQSLHHYGHMGFNLGHLSPDVVARLSVEYARTREDLDDEKKKCTVLTRNLNFSTGEQDLCNEFSRWGPVKSCVIMRYPSGRSKGYGLVVYTCSHDAQQAVENMNRAVVGGRKLHVTSHHVLAQRQEEKKGYIESSFGSRMPVHSTGFGGSQYQGQLQSLPPGQWCAPRYMEAPPSPYGTFGCWDGMAPNHFPQQYQDMHCYTTGNGWQPQPQPHLYWTSGYPQQQYQQHHYQQLPIWQAHQPPQSYAQPIYQQPVVQSCYAAPPQIFPPSPLCVSEPSYDPMTPLNHETLAHADSQTQRAMLGHALLPHVEGHTAHSSQAQKITGMLLQMDLADVLYLLESPQALADKVKEAYHVLQQSGALPLVLSDEEMGDIGTNITSSYSQPTSAMSA